MADRQPESNKERQFMVSNGEGGRPSSNHSMYELTVQTNPEDYEAWLDYITFEKSNGNPSEIIREIFERAIVNVPNQEKQFWCPHYVLLWLNYAWFEEFEANDIEGARKVYSRFLRLIPHENFSFAEVWFSVAQQQSNFNIARSLLEHVIQRAPSRKIFRAYIAIELKLGNIRLCQMLYASYVQWCPDDDYCCWLEYIGFEKSQSNPERARFLYNIAINQPELLNSKPLLNSYIDFETSEREFENVRELYQRLLRINKGINVWIRYAQFEASLIKEVPQEEKRICIKRVRKIFVIAIMHFRLFTSQRVNRQARAILVEEWEDLERGFGSLGDVNLVRQMFSRFKPKGCGIHILQ